MTIVVTGGGSGGHITPILAVAHELKQLRRDVRIVYVGQRGGGLLDIPSGDPNIDEVRTVSAGKFRRYHGEGWRQIFDVRTQFLNMRDAFRLLAGIGQSYRLLRKLQPEVVFTRGGFVSVPVALASAWLKIPYVTHDSDSVPSLANRLIAKKAALHAVALPPEVYPYPAAKTVTVGIPLDSHYERVTPELQRRYRRESGLPEDGLVLFATGGGNGAESLNSALQAVSPALLAKYPQLTIVHVAGRAHEARVAAAYDAALTAELRPRVLVRGFITDLYRQSGAADVIIARAGATNLAEFAVQGKACIIMPAAKLVGGHQSKNARILAESGAVIVLDDAEALGEQGLEYAVSALLDDESARQSLGASLARFGRQDAAERLAVLLLEQIKGKTKRRRDDISPQAKTES